MSINVDTFGAEFGFERKTGPAAGGLVVSPWFYPKQAYSPSTDASWFSNNGNPPGNVAATAAGIYIPTTTFVNDPPWSNPLQVTALDAIPATAAVSSTNKNFAPSLYTQEYHLDAPIDSTLVRLEFEIIYRNHVNVPISAFTPTPVLEVVMVSASVVQQFSMDFVQLQAAASETFTTVGSTVVGSFISAWDIASQTNVSSFTIAQINSDAFGIAYRRGLTVDFNTDIAHNTVEIDNIRARYQVQTTTRTSSNDVVVSKVVFFALGDSSPEFGFEIKSVALNGTNLAVNSYEFGFETSQAPLTSQAKPIRSTYGYESSSAPLLVTIQPIRSTYGFEASNAAMTSQAKPVRSSYGFEIQSAFVVTTGTQVNKFGYEDNFTQLQQNQRFGMNDSSSEYGYEQFSPFVGFLQLSFPESEEFGYESSSPILRTFVNRPEELNAYSNFPLARVIRVDSFPRTHTVKPGMRLTKPKGAFRTREVPAFSRTITASPDKGKA